MGGGADVNKAGSGEMTPLINASWEGKEDVVRVLLEAGADVGARDHWGKTALYAARKKEWDAVVAVLEEGGGGE